MSYKLHSCESLVTTLTKFFRTTKIFKSWSRCSFNWVPFQCYLKLILIVLSVTCLTGCKEKTRLPQPDPDNGGLFLPQNFQALVVTEGIGRARHIAINDNGDIYVKLSSSEKNGGCVALRDTTDDGKADVIKKFGGTQAGENFYGTGMRIHNGYLYFSSARVLYRNKLARGKLVPDSSTTEVVLTDDHAHGVHWHITKPLSFDDKGYMYVPFGSPTNACQDVEDTPNGAPGGKGLDPCPELEEHGGIWRFDANKTGLTQKDGLKFSTGIRSVVAMDWNPEDGNLYIVMHGRDNLHSLFPDLYSPWQSAMLPSEEFLRVKEGSDFGWPYCYYDQLQQKKVLAPEYGGDGKNIGRCGAFDLPVMGFPGHWAPNDLLFYQGDQFPDRYKNGAFITFHGSTNRSPYPQAGYFVGFVPFANGNPAGDLEIFADGFTGADTVENTDDAAHRPMGLAVGPDGSLYVTDSRKGKIWRIMYSGAKDNFGQAHLAQMEKRKSLPHIKTPHEVEDDLQKGVARDRKLYNTFCAICHQPDGKGAQGRFPPLANTDWVTGDKKRLISLTLKGLEGSIEVNGEAYNSVMPAHSFLSDEDISLILTYIRQGFGNKATAISVKEVKEVRDSLKF